MIEKTFQDWRPRLLHFCTQLLRNVHDAEEVVQDVFTQIVQHGARYDLTIDPGVLLFRLARNRCIDVRRKKKAVASDSVEPAARADAAALDIDEALTCLRYAEREALLLTAIDGLGYREVAAILHCSLGSVANLRFAAIEKLRRRLTP